MNYNDKKKVLILTNSDSGLYDFRKELLQRLIAEGREVFISVPEGKFCDRIRAIGCQVIPAIMERRGMNPSKDWKLLKSYILLMKEIRPSIVLTYTVKPNIYGGIACRLRKIPYMVNITGLGTALEHPGPLRSFLLWLYRRSLSKASVVFFQNAYNKEFMENHRCGGNRSILLPGSGVNLAEHPYVEYPEEKDGIRLLSVMRIMKDKGIEEYLACIPRIHEKYPDVRFAIAGAYEEESRQRYEPMIKTLQEQGILRYYGYREDLNEIVADSHIIVHPSYHEGMSNVLLEAAACGRPVVASNIRGCIETFLPGVSGESCKRMDAGSLQEAIERVLQVSTEERARMGCKGRTHVEAKFDREDVIAIYQEEIRRITDELV